MLIFRGVEWTSISVTWFATWDNNVDGSNVLHSAIEDDSNNPLILQGLNYSSWFQTKLL